MLAGLVSVSPGEGWRLEAHKYSGSLLVNINIHASLFSFGSLNFENRLSSSAQHIPLCSVRCTWYKYQDGNFYHPTWNCCELLNPTLFLILSIISGSSTSSCRNSEFKLDMQWTIVLLWKTIVILLTFCGVYLVVMISLFLLSTIMFSFNTNINLIWSLGLRK